jgi:zinc transport system substrate-binding protein
MGRQLFHTVKTARMQVPGIDLGAYPGKRWQGLDRFAMVGLMNALQSRCTPMRNRLERLMIVLALSALFPGAGLSLDASPVRVGVSVLPLESVVEAIGGDRVEVLSLQREGDSCSVFEPRPSVVSWLSGADVFFRTGAVYETVVMKKVRSQFAGLEVIDLRDSVELLQAEAAGKHHHAHGDGEPCPVCSGEAGVETDPHIWLDPLRMTAMTDRISEVLVRIDPEGAAGYRERSNQFKQTIEALDSFLSGRLEAYSGRGFFIYHPALRYFADRYGLKQVSIAGGHHEPSVRELHGRIREAREQGIKTVFIQPQENRKHAAIVAEAVGARLVEIDPMARDWLAALRDIGEKLALSFEENAIQ